MTDTAERLLHGYVANFIQQTGCAIIGSMIDRTHRTSLRLALFLLARGVLLLLTAGLLASPAHAQTLLPPGKMIAKSDDAYVAYDEQTHTWEIGTASMRRQMRYTPEAGFRLISLLNKQTGKEWLARDGKSMELAMELEGQALNSSRHFTFRDYRTLTHPSGALELTIVLAHSTLRAHLHYLVFPRTSIIEHWLTLENSGDTPLRHLAALEAFSIALAPSAEALAFSWVQGVTPGNVDKSQVQPVPTLRVRSVRLTEGREHIIYSHGRSSEDHLGWFVVSAPTLREGLVGGIAWSGGWQVRAQRQGRQTFLQPATDTLRFDLAPGDTFETPRRFLGFFTGTLNDAAHATHDFARRYLLPPRPHDFPWTQYNTYYAFYHNLHEERLYAQVDAAAELGLEVFVIDAAWYAGSVWRGDFSFGLGTWREHPDKFPSGLAAFAEYVHRRGMKFGLWVEPERVDLDYAGPGTDISLDWIAPGTALDAIPPEGAARTAQICLGHRAAREWMKNWVTRLVRDYHLDWLIWDNNMWMPCSHPDQPGYGDYMHIHGLYEVLDYLRQTFPTLVIENCAGGGNRMDLGLLRRTHIGWLSDETDPSYRVRYHSFGASLPFPPEYLDTWLVESWWEHLADGERQPEYLRRWLHSRMMGAFGISVDLTALSPTLRTLIAKEIEWYKQFRDIIANGKRYWLFPQSDLETHLEPPTTPDAALFYDSATQRGVAFLFRGATPWQEQRVVLRGLSATTLYDVTTTDGAFSARLTGRQLMNQSLPLRYEQEPPSIIVLLRPASRLP